MYTKFNTFKTVLSVSLLIALLVTGIFWLRRKQMNDTCIRNLEQISKALLAYCNDAPRERYPALSVKPGQLMFDPKGFYPRYLRDASVMISPFQPNRNRVLELASKNPDMLFDDQSFWYTGYIFSNEHSAEVWLHDYRRYIAQGKLPPEINEIWPEYLDEYNARQKAGEAEIKDFDERLKRLREEWVAEGRRGDPQSTLMMFRPEVLPDRDEMHLSVSLREGVERCFMRDQQNPDAIIKIRRDIPILIERPELHGNGGHVLFMDGHVEFVPYPGPFPMTKNFIEGLRSLNNLRK